MLIDTYDQQGKKAKQTRLPSEIFGVKMNSDLVHQVAVSQAANRRRVIAHTKGRGEVRGGGIKPWRQKGTGRARHGSIRSPLWIGGGVTFGPTKERTFGKKINKKMNRKALTMVLAAKAREGFLILLDSGFPIKQAKTKAMASFLKKLPCKGENCLIVLPKIDRNVILAARNIFKVETRQARDLNALDLLSFKYVLLPKESIKVIRETFVK